MRGPISTLLIVGLGVAGCGEKLDGDDTGQSSSSGAAGTTELTGGASETGATTVLPTGGETGGETVEPTGGSADASSGDTTTGTTAEGTSSETTAAESTGEPVCAAPEFPDAAAPPSFAACPEIQAESRWCLTFRDDTVQALGLDTQTDCTVVALAQGSVEGGSGVSMGVVGGDLFTCSTNQGNGVVTRISLADGTVESSEVPCIGVTTWRGHPLVMGVGEGLSLVLFMGWDAVLQGTPAWELPIGGSDLSTITTQGDVLYGARHSDDRFSRFTMPCAEPLGPVTLAGFDDWMEAIAVTADLRYYTFGFTYPGLRSFAVEDGAAAEDWPDLPTDGGAGLACFTQAR